MSVILRNGRGRGLLSGTRPTCVLHFPLHGDCDRHFVTAVLGVQ